MALYSVVAVSSRRAALIGRRPRGRRGPGRHHHRRRRRGRHEHAIGGVASWLLGWLAGENTRAGRMYAAQQAERAAEKAAAAAAERAEQVRRALADERAQIARELHDIVAHAMSVIAVRSGVARMVIDTDPQQAREALAIIETTTRRSLREMRLLVGVLRDDGTHNAELSPVPGLGDLDRLLADTAAAGVDVEVNIDGAVRALPPAADLSAYRIVQEALTNVVRHAGPTRAWVQISYRPDAVSIEVTRRRTARAGTAHSPRAGSGHGLIGMRERSRPVRRRADRRTDAADGFRVWASLPTAELRVGDYARERRCPVTISVVIADDQALVRGGFVVMVGCGARHGGARRGRERRRGRRPGPRAPPRRGPDGYPDAGSRRHRGHPGHHHRPRDTAGARVLMLTTFDLDDYVYQALRPAPAGSCSRTPSPNSSWRRSASWPPATPCWPRTSPAA
jgi:signal transduction histidine kinase